jgi:hypothetical protein
VAEGTAGGASAAFNVTRTVSFLSGTLDVCLDGAGGWFSFSLMRAGFCGLTEQSKKGCPAAVKPGGGISPAFFDALSRGS